jgi:hypothetical protein
MVRRSVRGVACFIEREVDMDEATAAPTAAPRVIAVVRSYTELIDALKARTAELGVTMEVVDHVAGLPLRYCSKILAPVPVKNVGPVSLGPLLGALGVQLIVAVDEEQFARVKNRLTVRKSSGAFRRPHPHPNSRVELRGNTAWGKIMAARRMLLLSPQERRRSAKRAARVRWANVKRALNGANGKPSQGSGQQAVVL